MNIRVSFNNKADIKDYIKKCERRFSLMMEECTEKIKEKKNLKFITLSGPTCSGKTTVSHIITRALEEGGHRVSVVSIDDYFFDREILNARKVLDYDSVATIDLELLAETVEALEAGKMAQIPIFDFNSGKRTGFKTLEPQAGEIVIFEGIQALYPEVSGLFDKNDTLGIYISVAQEACFGKVCVSAREQRLLRRLVRDCKKRSSTPEFTLTLWKSVCENEDKSILPYEKYCDIRLDSLLGYELSVLKERVLPLLAQIGEDSEHGAYARELEKIFDGVESIEANLVPSDSLFMEFIP